MRGRPISPRTLAGAGLTALVHAGLLAGVVLAGPFGGRAHPPADRAFTVSIIEWPAPEPVEVIEPPRPAPPAAAPPAEPPAEPRGEAPASPQDLAAEPAPRAPADAPAGPATPPPAGLTGAPAPAGADAGAVLLPSADSGRRSRDDDFEAYARSVRARLADFAPRQVAGARDCRVSFQLSPEGDVVSVTLETGSGARLYDRRCLKSVTAAVPFPAAPSGTGPDGLAFVITIKSRP